MTRKPPRKSKFGRTFDVVVEKLVLYVVLPILMLFVLVAAVVAIQAGYQPLHPPCKSGDHTGLCNKHNSKLPGTASQQVAVGGAVGQVILGAGGRASKTEPGVSAPNVPVDRATTNSRQGANMGPAGKLGQERSTTGREHNPYGNWADQSP
jgi:hypothetical protein